MLPLENEKIKPENKLVIWSTLMWSKKFDVAFVDPEIVVVQCLHLALKLPSTFSGISKCLNTTGMGFLAAITILFQVVSHKNTGVRCI